MVRKKRRSEEDPCPGQGVSRRGFLTSVTAGTLGTIAVGRGWNAGAQGTVPEPVDGAMVQVTLRVNGRTHRLMIEPRWTLLEVLRDRLGLTGTKPGCERGECGACTVLMDGVARYACLTLALEAEGHEVTTIEGLMKGEELGDVQRAFVEEDAFQCGFCTPGQILAAEGLLGLIPYPSVQEIREGLSGNLCRCGAYDHIVKAVRRAADGRRGKR